MSNNRKIKGGVADKLSVKDIANKFDISVDMVEKELEMGVKVEMEHVDDKELSRDIAMDHLVEFPDYYTRLKNMEKEGKNKWENKVNENKQLIKKLLREVVNLSVSDETSVSTAYDIYYNDRKVGFIEVGRLNSGLSDDALEIIGIKIDSDYGRIGIGSSAVKALWKAYPDINTLVMMPTQDSRAFWEKIGARRLNDSYHMIQRGH